MPVVLVPLTLAHAAAMRVTQHATAPMVRIIVYLTIRPGEYT